ncbi:stage V sporulation protein D, partial [Patescibacteria group bacterium]|nr:stage V sporulation protein D [Patescibacteria group bacterium]
MNKRKIHIVLPFLFIFLAFGLIEFRLYQLQIVQHQQFSEKAKKEQVRVIDIFPERGIIYDRNMEPLAMNISSYSLYARPGKISQPQILAEKLFPILKTDKSFILKKLKNDRVFVWLARKLSLEEKRKIEEFKISGIGFMEEKKRFYLQRELASHILGFVGIDNQGLSGIEYYYEDKLKGEKGRLLLKEDALGYKIPFTEVVLKEMIPGKSIVLTINSTVQSIVEQELSLALEQTSAVSVEALFMNPQTGEIIALANKPDYDPNNYSQCSPYDVRNRIVQSLYEPGSTFKVITASAILDDGVMDMESKIYCSEFLRIADHTFSDWKRFEKEMSFAQVIHNSSDTGTIKAALKMGKKTLYHYITLFGLTRQTGIDLPGEARGILRPASKWSATDLPCISIGQGIAITPLQIVVALCSVVNEGKLLKPYIVKSILDLEGKSIWQSHPVVVRKVIAPSISEKMRKILGGVVSEGTGKKSQIEGYSIGGKTGTAQIPLLKERGYSPDR